MLLSVQENSGGLVVADLADCTVVLRPLDDVRPVAGTAALEVSRLLSSRGFVHEVAHREHLTVCRYGAALWTWLVEGFAASLTARFLADESPIVEIGDNDRLQDLSWELLNTSIDAANPDWFALRGVVRRRCSVTHEITECMAGRPVSEALLITARPYAADDVPADIPAHAIAKAADRHGRMELAWLPSASRNLLQSVPNVGRRQLVHLDMHGVHLHTGVDNGPGEPYLLLEGDTGPDPCQIAELLRLLNGAPPHAILATSCGADVTGLPAQQTLQGQALQHGVDLVIASRRRLTPEEVNIFSTGFYSSKNFPTALDMATRDGRRALYEAARTSEHRTGRYAWGSFTIYQAHEARTPDIPTTSRSGNYQSPPPEVPPWILYPPGRAQLIVIQADGDGYKDWRERVQWWSRVLVTSWEIREVKAPQSLAGGAGAPADRLARRRAPLIRIHDWTKLTTPEQILDMATTENGPIADIAIPSAEAPVWDVIIVGCAPEALISTATGQRVTLIPATGDWSAADLPPECSTLGRWLSIAEGDVEPGAAARAIGVKLCGPDKQFDVLLGQLRQQIQNSGYCEDDLAGGLTSFSAGFYHHLDLAPQDEAEARVYATVRSFCRFSHLAGLTRRKTGGRLVLDVFHPRLAAAVRRWVEARAEEAMPPWHEWPFRTSITTPELGWHVDRAFPRTATLGDRLNRPDRVLGPDLAATTARNYIYRALTELHIHHQIITWWWEGLGSLLSTSDRVCLTAIRKSFTRRAKNRSQRSTPTLLLAITDAITPEMLAEIILSPLDVPSGILNPMLMPADSKTLMVESFEMPAQISDEWLQHVVDRTPWPEDQAWYLRWGAYNSGRQDPALAEDLASRAIELSIVADGPHALALCLDAIHTKAAIFRNTGRWADWNDSMNLAVGLLRDVDWTELASSVDELLEEIARGDTGRQLRLTGELLHTAADRRGVDLTELITHRSMALIAAERFLEADELLTSADLTRTSKKARSIILVYRAEINQCLGNDALALDLCAELANYAEGTVRAHAFSVEGRVAARTGDHDRALRCYKRGWDVAGGSGTHADLCGLGLCRELLVTNEVSECLATVEQVRRRGNFPFSARVCVLGAVAASVIGKDEAEIRSMLVPAIWGLNSVEDVSLVWMMASHGYERMINEVADEVYRLTEAWMLGDVTISVPPEVNVDRSEFSRYRLTQLLERGAAWRTINEEHSGPELAMANYNEVVVRDMARVVKIADGFLHKGEPRIALDWYRGAVSVLDNEELSATADAQLLLGGAAYYIGSAARQLGRLEESLQWGKFALRVYSRNAIISNADHAVVEHAREGRARALELTGNCYFDQQHFTTSYRYHLDALLTRLDLDTANTDCRTALNVVGAQPEISGFIVHSLFNLGNSIGALNDDDDLYEAARTTAVLAASRMPDLGRFATWPEGRHVLGGLLVVFMVQLHSDDAAVSHALSRLQNAFGANPPRIEDYMRQR